MFKSMQDACASENNLAYNCGTTIGVARGGAKGPCPPKFLENIVILCFEVFFQTE